MSANEIELTFIRCQNCKSLMPSTAQACGMCGFQKGEQQEGKSKVRLRQESDVNINETISEEKTAESARTENATKEMESPFHEESKQVRESGARREYLNFGDSERGQERDVKAKNEEIDPLDDGGDSDDFSDDDDSDDTEPSHGKDYHKAESSLEDRPKKKKRRRKKKPQSQAALDAREDKEDNVQHPQASSDFESQNQLRNRQDRQPETPKKEMHFRSDNQAERQDFKSKDEVMQHSDKQDDRQQDNFKREPRDRDDRAENYRRSEDRSNDRQSDRQNDRRGDSERQHSSRQQDQGREEPLRSENTSYKNTLRPEEEEGKLMGWLVNYTTNGKGASFELRVGRRFIGRQALRSDDIIIQDSALSTPHSLIQIEGGQVFLQDLMSENGTFVKNADSVDFVRKDTTTRLVHGDVIRLGSYELIVCLVPNA